MHCTKAVAIAALLLLGRESIFAAAFPGAQALTYTQEVTALGPRPSGSAAHRKMQAYITGKLRSWKVPVEEDHWTAATPEGPVPMTNLIAKFGGAAAGRVVVISGHYDTKRMHGFVGANDGGSSTGMLLALAEVLAKGERRSGSAVWLVWLDGEEAVRDWTDTDSLYGSRRLAARWKADGTARKVQALINVDMIGDRDLSLMYEYNSTDWLRDLVWSAADELRLGRYFGRTFGAVADDHLPFLAAGIPALDLIDLDYGPFNSYWHTERDTLDKLNAESFRVVGDVLLRALGKLEDRR